LPDDLSVLIDRDVKPQNLSKNILFPAISYEPSLLTSIGSDIERQRLNLITALIQKRKKISEVTVDKIESLILYCDNKILDIGDKYKLKSDPDAQRAASLWQKAIIDLEKEKISEEKDLFRDSLFLRNEWIKSLLTYNEEKSLDALLKDIERTN